MADLHTALKTTEIGRINNSSPGVEFALVRLQHGKNDQSLTLHARPNGWTSAGMQTTDLFSYLGFARGRCAFLSAECYATEVEAEFNLEAFSSAFSRMYSLLQSAEAKLSACGFFIPQPEGTAFFFGRPSTHARAFQTSVRGDGHNSPKSKMMKQAEDDFFRFMFTWIEGGADKGWVTHYRPKHPPLSPEMQVAFDFLGLHLFADCPEFDFEPCSWRFTAFNGGSGFDGNAGETHGWFGAHAQNFSPGIRDLLSLQAEAERFRLSIWPKRPARLMAAPSAKARAAAATVPPSLGAAAPNAEVNRFDFDVALSFAGTERLLAEKLTTLLTQAGLKVFYDDL
jgi:hypothetical protein